MFRCKIHFFLNGLTSIQAHIKCSISYLLVNHTNFNFFNPTNIEKKLKIKHIGNSIIFDKYINK